MGLRCAVCLALICVVCQLSAAATLQQPRGPQPGDVYREYAVHNGGNIDWRVTDPRATAAGAQRFLPNPTIKVQVDDLQHAVRAEALLDRWGGHLRTTAKRIRFNSNAWLTVPEIQTIPADERPESFYAQDNPIIPVPLEQLREGNNTIEGTCAALDQYGWGQWGMYSVILRVYYDPKHKDYASGRIMLPADNATISENPTVRVEPQVTRNIARVDVLAWYDGFDEDGDGVFQDWHRAYFQPLRGEAADVREHVGTMWRSPYELTWNTRWIPDQQPQSIKLVARIQNARGVWCVSEPVAGLSLKRTEHSVRMYGTSNLPRGFGVRVGRIKNCDIQIRDSDLDKAVEAVMPLRTWHGWDGHHEPLLLNGRAYPIGGKNHHFDYDLIPIAVDSLKHGANTLTIHSKTEHHMLEVLWPGPALIVRYRN